MPYLKLYLSISRNKRIFHPSFHGMTMADLMVSILMLGIMLSVLFYFFKIGSTAWLQSSRDVDLENNVIIALTRMETELRETSYGSVSIASVIKPNDSISFLSVLDDTTNIGTYNGTSPAWRKYILYFLVYDPESSAKDYDSYKLCKRDVTFGSFYEPNYAVTQPINMMQYHYGLGGPTYTHPHSEYTNDIIRPKDTYTSETKIISRYITSLTFTIIPGYDNKVLDIELRARKKSDWKKESSVEIKLVKSILFRN